MTATEAAVLIIMTRQDLPHSEEALLGLTTRLMSISTVSSLRDQQMTFGRG